METIRVLHRSEYVETKRALDEQICAQKDAIKVITREALNESKSLKYVINNLDTQLQSTQRELEQSVDVEARLRDSIHRHDASTSYAAAIHSGRLCGTDSKHDSKRT